MLNYSSTVKLTLLQYFSGWRNWFIILQLVFFFFFNFIATLFIYLFIFGCVGSSVRARAFSSCGKWGPLFIAVWGPLFIAVRGPFTIAAPPVAGHRLQTRRLSSCGSRAQLLRGMWGSSQTRARTRVPCISRQILNHCATREALQLVLRIDFALIYWVSLTTKHSNSTV